MMGKLKQCKHDVDKKKHKVTGAAYRERERASPSMVYPMCASRGASECHKYCMCHANSSFLSNDLDDK